ncbi:MAG: SpoIIE family protein phosphatase [Gammaproteobacteria bacterium]|nr:SpoIIE family protein phosphatase [Gammaproteobacteria bacterium]
MLNKILVVDDEPDLEALVKQKMRREIRRGEYAFSFAGNGVQALEVLRGDQEINIVLTDINMPEMDGLTLLEHLPGVNADIHSVVISAYGDMKNIRLAMNRGAFDFVTKPVDFDDLKITLSRTIQRMQTWLEASASKERLASIQVELETARKMQQSILPATFPSNDDYEIFGSMSPARSVGGDFFDVIRLENGKVAIAIADVSGKGITAGLFMMTTRTILKGAAIGTNGPAETLRETNTQLAENNDAMMFVTTFYAEYDYRDRKLTFANGGHNPPLVVKADGTATELEMPPDVALGLMGDLDYDEASIKLEPGDHVVMYTDGVNEAETHDGDFYGMERFIDLFKDGVPASAKTVTQRVFDSVHEFVGDFDQSDDITCLTLSVK